VCVCVYVCVCVCESAIVWKRDIECVSVGSKKKIGILKTFQFQSWKLNSSFESVGWKQTKIKIKFCDSLYFFILSSLLKTP